MRSWWIPVVAVVGFLGHSFSQQPQAAQERQDVTITNPTKCKVKFVLPGKPQPKEYTLHPGQTESYPLAVEPGVQLTVKIVQLDGTGRSFTIVGGGKYEFRMDGELFKIYLRSHTVTFTNRTRYHAPFRFSENGTPQNRTLNSGETTSYTFPVDARIPPAVTLFQLEGSAPLSFPVEDGARYEFRMDGRAIRTYPISDQTTATGTADELDLAVQNKHASGRKISEENRQLRLNVLKNVRSSNFGFTTDGDMNPPRSSLKSAADIERLWSGERGFRMACTILSKIIVAKANINSGNRANVDRALNESQGLNAFRANVPPNKPRDELKGFQKDELVPGDLVWFDNPYHELLALDDRLSAEQKLGRFPGEEGSNVFYAGDNQVINLYDRHSLESIESHQQGMGSPRRSWHSRSAVLAAWGDPARAGNFTREKITKQYENDPETMNKLLQLYDRLKTGDPSVFRILGRRAPVVYPKTRKAQ